MSAHVETLEKKAFHTVETVYKAAKIIGAVLIAFGFLMTVRDRLQAVPVIQDTVKAQGADIQDLKDQVSYIVGGMEMLTGRHYRPRATSQNTRE